MMCRVSHGSSVSRRFGSAGELLLAVGAILSMVLATVASAQAQEPAEPAVPSGPLAAIKGGTPTVDLRLRYEQVEDDGFADPARALTLRTTLGYRTGTWRGLALFAEAEDVSAIGNALYADGAGGGRSDRPVVGDPEGTALHQALLAFERGDTKLQAGRFEIVLGDERFVGNVGWRQHHQAYDAVTVTTRRLPRVELLYGYLAAVHRVNRARDDLDGHLLRGVIDAGAAGKLTLHGLLLDYETPARRGLSTATWGAELAGERAFAGRWKALWELEHALQSDHGDNPGEVDADYTYVKAGAASAVLTGFLAWERLSGSPGEGRFSTPLATLHRWNGWADVFLVTPPDGLEDAFVQLSGTAGRFGWTAAAHDFRAASGDARHGRELDLQLTTKLANGLALGAKGAVYEADRFGRDTSKLMVWATFAR
jgi:hypothetical protein